MCDQSSVLRTDGILSELFSCNKSTGHYDILCPNSLDEETMEACLIWSSAANPEASLGPPALSDGPTRFACYDPGQSTLRMCNGACKGGVCVAGSWKKYTTAIVIAAIILASLLLVRVIWKTVTKNTSQ